jgi:restriction system protein
MTVVEAIKETMKLQGRALTIPEAYEGILETGLYTFNTEKPMHVVASQIRRHCKGLAFPSASATKHFEQIGEGRYYFLTNPIQERLTQHQNTASPKKSLLRNLQQAHDQYTQDVRSRLLEGLKRIDPEAFEHFAKKLLDAYGFTETRVTQRYKDGGIDGYGKLKVGLAHVNVAFQCKRYTNKPIGRPMIHEFRGAIQGKVEQGLYFTTSRFVPNAEEVSFQPGAVPIVLLDGNAIVDLMIERRVGVEIDHMPVPTVALDMLFADDLTSAQSLKTSNS